MVLTGGSAGGKEIVHQFFADPPAHVYLGEGDVSLLPAVADPFERVDDDFFCDLQGRQASGCLDDEPFCRQTVHGQERLHEFFFDLCHDGSFPDRRSGTDDAAAKVLFLEGAGPFPNATSRVSVQRRT